MTQNLLRILLLLFVFGTCCGIQTDARKKNEKKRTPVIRTPEPDPEIIFTPLHANLTPQDEVMPPADREMRWKEGIDVSHYQHTVDWQAVARADIAYAYMKATEGVSLIDDQYVRNITEARKAGIKVGSYHFFRAHLSVEEQFKNMTSMVKKEEQDLLPIVDVEQTNRCSTSVLVARLKKFLELLTQHYGKKPILYTFVNFYNKHLAGRGFDDYPLMIAFYRDAQPELSDGRKYTIWQYTSHGDVPGVDGDVDRSMIMDGFSLLDILYK